MTHTLSDTFASWPAPVAQRAEAIRALLLDAHQSANLPPLDEALKWGQPAWRPRKGGTTLRLDWTQAHPKGRRVGELPTGQESHTLTLYVDCKTDLCARMMQDFPDAFAYTPPRAMAHPVDAHLPEDAITHLARIAFRYKRLLPAG